MKGNGRSEIVKRGETTNTEGEEEEEEEEREEWRKGGREEGRRTTGNLSWILFNCFQSFDRHMLGWGQGRANTRNVTARRGAKRARCTKPPGPDSFSPLRAVESTVEGSLPGLSSQAGAGPTVIDGQNSGIWRGGHSEGEGGISARRWRLLARRTLTRRLRHSSACWKRPKM